MKDKNYKIKILLKLKKLIRIIISMINIRIRVTINQVVSRQYIA